jgi:transposase InsO family protein
LQPITPTSDVPFGTIALDFIVKLPKSGGCDTILTITDHDCTKAVILVPCKEAMGTEEFLELYRERVFPYTGIPKKIISDRDVRFTSDMFKELCKQLAIQHNMSTTYHPQTDGQSERTNQNVETILRIFCNQAQDNWREWLPVTQYILNSRPSATTRKTPYDLWMGVVPHTHQPERVSALPQFQSRAQALYQARKEARDAILAAQKLQSSESNYHQYKVGD